MFVQYVLIFIGEQAEIVAEKQLEGRSLETTDEVGNEFKDAPLVLKEHFAAELWPEIQGTVTHVSACLDIEGFICDYNK
ncbi:hypothetical protein HBI56_059980 [Parastagonospora nodorum]|uniref:Uncharacterized protein n=1 Tax=Phaeosphaeria nodorum (strain SN15 / ATCC MYA-4574 / FGSC 10173) TaxID=321614 RepID=A0A7U2F2V1_PHANO|nr:hypothetical protein HBH56_158630 [Parastagonospora nodorum]QRC97372.1 hypothetical protein JI435_434830 [Parastagonospora nodorum SN15]KAH3922507.1 hypothetical protein HBH54_223060 [Parastagonospora nodorum]KAH3946979.1 hypothetical protein HBH53_123280 [Parastagonospora nodorum]KAH3969536.1 hypothetical protein HBH52_171290 [Parastagonospora nodorum]